MNFPFHKSNAKCSREIIDTPLPCDILARIDISQMIVAFTFVQYYFMIGTSLFVGEKNRKTEILGLALPIILTAHKMVLLYIMVLKRSCFYKSSIIFADTNYVHFLCLKRASSGQLLTDGKIHVAFCTGDFYKVEYNSPGQLFVFIVQKVSAGLLLGRHS